MPQECPEFGRGGDGREGGVKAVPQARDRSPSPGGTLELLLADEHTWGLRRGVNEADDGLVGMHEIPESGGSDRAQVAENEVLMNGKNRLRGRISQGVRGIWPAWFGSGVQDPSGKTILPP